MEEHVQSYLEENPISPDEQLALARSYAKGTGRTQDYAKAAYWYEKAAAQGNPEAANCLGVLYAKGQGVEKDLVRASSLYRKAAEAGHTTAAKNLAEYYRKGKGMERDYAKAACWYEKAANAGNDKAAVQLGLLYAKGNGVVQDHTKAALLYQQAADKGNTDAMNYLGVLYEAGKGVAKDLFKAVELYTKAAEAGHTTAARNLANCYRIGNGVEQDYSQAAYWYEKAANAGNDKAAVQLGLLYAKGNGVVQDHTKAALLYQQAADKGNTDAMNYLGVLYEAGKGVARDLFKAVELYTKAAEEGHARASCNLGNCYEEGSGVAKDYTQAAYWYEKAIEGGIADAMNSLALFYDRGKGVPKDHVRAAQLYRQAAEKNHPMGTYNLGVCYQLGEGVEQSALLAISWYEKALTLELDEKTKAELEYKIACCYLRIDMPGDPNQDQGMYWLHKAITHNHTKAQSLLLSLASPPLPPSPPAVPQRLDPVPVAKIPKAPQKEKKKRTPISRLKVMIIVFLTSMAVCFVLGNLLNGDWVWYSAGEDYSVLYTFLFLNIPNCLATIVGLPLASGFGKIFTLLSSLFFLVISVKMYTTPAEKSIDDITEGVDGSLRRCAHLLCCFSFFQMFCSVMADNYTAIVYLRDPFFNFVPPLFLIGFILLDLMLCESSEENQKSICRLLASLGFTLGIAGLSQLVFTLQWNNIVLLPMLVNHLWTVIANLCGNSIFGTIVMVLIQCVCAVILGLSLKMLITGAKKHLLSVLFGGGIIYILFLFHYLYGWFTQNFYSRITVLWIFLIVVAVIWSRLARQQSRRHSIITLIGGLGTIAMPLICLDTLRTFSPGIIYNLERFANLLTPVAENISGFFIRMLYSNQLASLILSLVFLILFLIFFFSLYAPLSADSDKDYFIPGDPRLVKICSWIFLLGYLLICTFRDSYPAIGYYVCALPLLVEITCFTTCLLQGESEGVNYHRKVLAPTLILCMLITFFAEIIAVFLAVVICVVLIFGAIAAGIGIANTPRTKTDVKLDRLSNALLGSAAIDDVLQQYKAGKISKQEAINLANMIKPVFSEKDRQLQEELKRLQDADD